MVNTEPAPNGRIIQDQKARSPGWASLFLLLLITLIITSNWPPVMFFKLRESDIHGKWILSSRLTPISGNDLGYVDFHEDGSYTSKISYKNDQQCPGFMFHTTGPHGRWHIGDKSLLFQSVKVSPDENLRSPTLMACTQLWMPALYVLGPNEKASTFYYLTKEGNCPRSFLLHIILSMVLIISGATMAFGYSLRILSDNMGEKSFSLSKIIHGCLCLLLLNSSFFMMTLYFLFPFTRFSAP